MRTLGIIPARAGSERLLHKNKALCCKRPLVLITLDEALKSALGEEPNRIVVSTDDPDIARWCRRAPYRGRCDVVQRPFELATATATTADVIRHTLTLYAGYDRVMLLQPTSPLRTAAHIDECLQVGTCVSVVRNGAIYLMDADRLMEFDAYYEMQPDESVDIDDINDLTRAERLMTGRNA